MTTDRWQRLVRAFEGALDRSGPDRGAWLDVACAGDPELRREVEALLGAHDTAGDFLDAPASRESEAVTVETAPAVRYDPVPSATPTGASLVAGTRVGPYRVLDEIGRGGMGVVYLAEDQRLGRLVALKALPHAVAGRHDLRERLRREARAAATISHPAVAIVYALEERDDDLFIVSEYVPGHTLRREIERGPLPIARTLAVAQAVAGALAAAHEAGIVHRDLKPENVLIGERGRVAVVDFGIALVEGIEGGRLTRADLVPGTPAYMAPEQLLGLDVDARADVYAFGMLLGEMLTGALPSSRHWTPDHLPPAVAAIVSRCLQIAPHARYASAREIVRALEQAGATPAAGRPAPGRRTTPQWWWAFHQAVAAIVYWLMVIPAWGGRVAIGGQGGRLFFFVVLAAVIVSANLRLHLWFTSVFYPAELDWVRLRSGRLIRVGDWVFALALVMGGLAIGDRPSALGVLLVAVGVGVAVAFVVIEPVTARAAGRGGD